MTKISNEKIKVQILSDIHLETYEVVPAIEEFLIPSAPYLLLAGDICNISKLSILEKFLKECSDRFQEVLYVLGNHEFYTEDSSKTFESSLAEVLSIDIPKVHVLHQRSVIIGDVCILGCPLWSYYPDVLPTYRVRIKGITTEQYNRRFREDLEFIEEGISYAKKNGLKTLVATHYPPSYSVAEGDELRGRKYRSLYYNNLDFLLTKEKVHTWIFGHVHQNRDFYVRTNNPTRLVGNQKGKNGENTVGFSKQKVIEV